MTIGIQGKRTLEVNILVVTGASGAGKTVAVKGLESRGLPGVRCFYFDQIGVPTAEEMQRDFGGGEQWQYAATEQWIMRLAQEENSGYLCVLDGQTRPSFVRSALSQLGPLSARIILLDCRSNVRKARLTMRGQPELADQHMDNWAIYLRGQADALGVPVIDTSDLSVDEMIDALCGADSRLTIHTILAEGIQGTDSIDRVFII